MESNPKQIPKELLPVAGRFLRQARTCRRLTITQAADRIGIPAEHLIDLEKGVVAATTDHVRFLIECYGGARGGAVDDFVLSLMMEKARQTQQTKRRKHLSLVSDDPRPWEKPRYHRLLQI